MKATAPKHEKALDQLQEKLGTLANVEIMRGIARGAVKSARACDIGATFLGYFEFMKQAELVNEAFDHLHRKHEPEVTEAELSLREDLVEILSGECGCKHNGR